MDFEPYYNGETPDINIYCELLERLFEQNKPTWLLVDGLDECRTDGRYVMSDFERFFEALLRLPSRWKVLVVSRKSLLNKVGLSPQVAARIGFRHIVQQDTEEDLLRYVDHRVSNLRAGEKSRAWGDAFFEEASKTLVRNAQGMFLWVKLVLQQLESHADRSPDRVRKTLVSTPLELHQVYASELGSLMAPARQHQARCQPVLDTVRWTVCAYRSLTVAEACAALDVLPVLQDRLEEYASSFLRIDEQRAIRNIHETAGTFLLHYAMPTIAEIGCSGRDIIIATHREIAIRALEVLASERKPSQDTLQDERQGTPPAGPQTYDKVAKQFFDRFRDRFDDYSTSSFLSYAAKFWPRHLLVVCPNAVDQELRGKLLRLCASDFCTLRWLILLKRGDVTESDLKQIGTRLLCGRSTYEKWMQRLFHCTAKRIPRFHRFWSFALDETCPPIHLAAFFDMRSMVAACLSRGYDIEQLDSNGAHPLHYAAFGDALNTTKLLVENGANIHATGAREGTPLSLSLRRRTDGAFTPDSFDVTKYLLEHGASPNCVSVERLNPWDEATKLLQRSHPADKPQIEGIRTLLRMHGAMPLGGRDHPVQVAAQLSDLDGMRRAFKFGLHANVICERGDTRLGTTVFETPIHAALGQVEVDEDVVRLLLEHGADVNIRQADGRTPLHLAASSHVIGVIKLLCESGADVNATADDGATPLMDLANSLRLHVRDSGNSLVQKVTPPDASFSEVQEEKDETAGLIQALSVRRSQDDYQIDALAGAEADSDDAIHTRGLSEDSIADAKGLGPLNIQRLRSGNKSKTASDIGPIDTESSYPSLEPEETHVPDAPIKTARNARDMLIKNGARTDLRDNNGKTYNDLFRRYSRLYGTPWPFDTFQIAPSTSTKHSPSAQDIFQVFMILEMTFTYRASRALILRIMDEARYWIVSSNTRTDPMIYQEGSDSRTYLRSHPLNIYHASHLRELHIVGIIHGHEWEGKGLCRGSYIEVDSWCDYGCTRASGEAIDLKCSPSLWLNPHARKSWSVREVVFGRRPVPRRKSPLGIPPFVNYRKPQWMDEVQTGDVFWFRLHARHAGWTCTARAAEIVGFTSPLMPILKQVVWKADVRGDKTG